jgi:hypothetical protein
VLAVERVVALGVDLEVDLAVDLAVGVGLADGDAVAVEVEAVMFVSSVVRHVTTLPPGFPVPLH